MHAGQTDGGTKYGEPFGASDGLTEFLRRSSFTHPWRYAMNWFLLALILLIIALLIKIVRDLRRLIAAGSHSGGAAPTNAGVAAMQGALTLLQTLANENRNPTAEECQQLRDLYAEAQAGHVSALSLEPLRNAIERLCP